MSHDVCKMSAHYCKMLGLCTIADKVTDMIKITSSSFPILFEMYILMFFGVCFFFSFTCTVSVEALVRLSVRKTVLVKKKKKSMN